MTKIDKIKKKLEKDYGILPGVYVRDVTYLLDEISERDLEIVDLRIGLKEANEDRMLF